MLLLLLLPLHLFPQGGNLLEAEDLLMAAEEAFDGVLNANPANIKALGNLGNALLCRGQLKVQLMGTEPLCWNPSPLVSSPFPTFLATVAAAARFSLLTLWSPNDRPCG